MNAIDILTVLQLRIAEIEIIWTITNGTRFCAFSTSSGIFPHEIEERRGFQRASLWTLCAPGHNFDLAPIEIGIKPF